MNVTPEVPRRILFAAGRVSRSRRRNPRPCAPSAHAGPLLNEAKYNAAGEPWTGCGECAACMSTIHHSQLRRAS